MCLGACSATPRLAPTYDSDPEVLARPEPEIFASGTVMGGDDPGTPIEWNLEEIVGFSHAVSLTTVKQSTVSVRSASRQGGGDAVWLVGTTLAGGGPAMVFGGVDATVDSLILVTENGEQLHLQLIDVPDEDWHLAVEELPSEWVIPDGTTVEVIALSDGAEVSREDLLGLDR